MEQVGWKARVPSHQITQRCHKVFQVILQITLRISTDRGDFPLLKN